VTRSSPALLLVLLALGCTTRATAPAEAGAGQTLVELTGTSWRLEELGGTPAQGGVEATLEFPEAGKASGRASCNRFFGAVEISGSSIRFGPLAATKMSCGSAADAQERRYLDALQAAERFDFDGPALRIHSRGVEQPLRFAR
jgi:heat shock protein HslJ